MRGTYSPGFESFMQKLSSKIKRIVENNCDLAYVEILPKCTKVYSFESYNSINLKRIYVNHYYTDLINFLNSIDIEEMSDTDFPINIKLRSNSYHYIIGKKDLNKILDNI